jgi:hypothetical protein
MSTAMRVNRRRTATWRTVSRVKMLLAGISLDRDVIEREARQATGRPPSRLVLDPKLIVEVDPKLIVEVDPKREVVERLKHLSRAVT